MSIDQTLGKLQHIIHETLPNLELFVDAHVHPTSQDCENLQKQLCELQDKLSVYKHLKTYKEISPSFGIHSKVSEAIVKTEEIKATEELKQDIPLVKKEEIREAKQEHKSEAHHKKLEISLNQKFQFINELFGKNDAEYNSAIDQLNNCENWADADSYLLGLKSVYNWKDDNESYKRLKELSKKCFE
jgi:chaperonin cofactor prefoldin